MYWMIGYLVIGFFVSLALLTGMYNDKNRCSFSAWSWLGAALLITILWPVVPLLRYRVVG